MIDSRRGRLSACLDDHGRACIFRPGRLLGWLTAAPLCSCWCHMLVISSEPALDPITVVRAVHSRHGPFLGLVQHEPDGWAAYLDAKGYGGTFPDFWQAARRLM